MLNNSQKKAFTLSEALIAAILVGIFCVAMMRVLKPYEIKTDALKKNGVNLYIQIEYAFKKILARNTKNYSFTNLYDASGTLFSIEDDGADAKLTELFKQYLSAHRNNSLDSAYKSSKIKDETGSQVGSLAVSSFTSGYVMKNGAYIAFKINKDCTTTESNLFDPSARERKTASNSCGLMFFDVNGDKKPNMAGVDQYIISVSKFGVN